MVQSYAREFLIVGRCLMKKFSLLFFILIIILLAFGTVFAAPKDVELILLSRYYQNQQCYGFYDMCGTTSWLGLAFHNGGTQPASVAFPSEVRIGGTSGSRHPIKNLRYIEVSQTITNLREWETTRPGTSFSSTLTIPAGKSYVVFFDIQNIGQYAAQWDTNVFFSVEITSEGSTEEMNISGVISQRGNETCSADQVCSAAVLRGSYTADGNGTVTVNVKNNMPMSAEITGQTDLSVTWTNAEGTKQTSKIENAVTWEQNPGWLGTGKNKTVSGTFKLPAEIASSNNSLILGFHFWHPSSLFFGNFHAQATLHSVSGLNGSVSGNYDTNGKNGTFKAIINNNQNKAVSVTLPTTGKVTDASGKFSTVTLNWNTTGPISMNAQGTATLNGTFSFNETSLIHNNSSLVLSADLTSEDSTGNVAGTVTRNADPNPVLKATGDFCRDYTASSGEMSFSYSIMSEANIDLQVELATTLHISGQKANPAITYTGCQNKGISCLSKINKGIYTIEPGETVTFSGKVSLEKPYPSADAFAETSLRYFADAATKVVYIGKTTNSCSAQPTPVTPEPPVINLTASGLCKSYTKGSSKVSFQYTLTNASDSTIPVELAATLGIENQTDTLAITYTDCKSGDESCMNRIKNNKDFEIKAGESVTFSGESTLKTIPEAAGFSIRTSLIYFPKGERKALFVGESSEACSGTPIDPDPVTPDLTTVQFCRSNKGASLNFIYTLKNNTSSDIILQLAKTMAVEGQAATSVIQYTSCTISGENCAVTGENFTLKAGKTAAFSGRVTMNEIPAKSDFYVYTSLLYTINGATKVYKIGQTASADGCSVVPVDPQPGDLLITSNSFYRSYNKATNKVTFTYTLVNDNEVAIPVDLARTIAADGQESTLPAAYTACSSAGTNCKNRINGYSFTLNAGESASFTGEITLPKAPVNADFWIYTSLVYTPNGMRKILDLGRTKTEIPYTPVTPEPPVIDLTASDLCRDYTKGSSDILVQYKLKNDAAYPIPVELASTLAVDGQSANSRITYTDCKIGTDSCLSRIANQKNITLNPGEEAVFTGKAILSVVPKDTAFKVRTSLVYTVNNIQKALFIGESNAACTATPIDPEPVKADLIRVNFCRTDLKNGKVAIQYGLQNNTNSDIILQLAKTLAITGLSGTAPITYTGCTAPAGKNCSITGENFTLKAGETIRFDGVAAVSGKLPSAGFIVRTSLVYTINGTTKSYYIGETGSACESVPVIPVPGDLVITSEGFCRDINTDKSKVSFTYTLKNETNVNIPVDLARTLAVDGQTRTLATTYTGCISNTTGECRSRIKEYAFELRAGEKVIFSGEAVLEKAVLNNDFSVYTSLVYTPNSIRKVLNLGQTATTCRTGSSDPAQNPANLSQASANLELTSATGYYSSCSSDENLHFTLKVRNSGTAAGIADLSSLRFTLDGNVVPADAIDIGSCTKSSVSGTDTMRCATELSTGKISIDPNVTLSLSGVYHPTQAISANSVNMTVQAEGISPAVTSFTASTTGTVCSANVEAITNNKGESILTNVSGTKDVVTLTIQFVNTGNEAILITPESIKLHQKVISSYQGTLDIEQIRGQITGKALGILSNGEAFTLSAMSSATLSLNLKVDMSEAFSSTSQLSWSIKIGNTTQNFFGTVNFAQSNPIPAINPIVPFSNEHLNFFALGEPQLPEILPATGFPTHGKHKPASIQPAHLMYEELNGLHLEIPVLEASMDLVRIPLDEKNEWAVEWLTNQAGVLSYSALPGEGTSVIAAHNHLDEMNIGPFLMLWQLENNDRIFVTDNDGKFLSYKVYANELLSPTDSDLIYKKAIPGSIVLLTCENEMPEGGYASRRVVFAEPLQ